MERDGLKQEHWRKSGQWISLNRKHAELVADDTVISNLFEKCAPCPLAACLPTDLSGNLTTAMSARAENMFCRECWVDAEHLSRGEPLWRFCVSDEHYVPTLLAFHGLEDETDCQVRTPSPPLGRHTTKPLNTPLHIILKPYQHNKDRSSR